MKNVLDTKLIRVNAQVFEQKEEEMDKTASIRGILTAMGVSSARVDAAINVLEGKQSPEQNENTEEILTPQALCERLAISQTTLWRLAPPFIRVLGRKRYCWEEVRTFLAKTGQTKRGAQ